MTLFRASHAGLLALLVAGASGCALNPETGMAGIEPKDQETNPHIWGSQSESIEVEWFSFWQGGARFERSREELKANELAIIEAMRVVADNGECYEDSGEATVTVTSDAGTVKEYFASEYGGGCQRDETVIAYEPVQALLELAGCNTAKGYDGSTLATAPEVTAGDGCYHGLFNASTTTPEWWFTLAVPSAGTLRVTLDGCGDRDLELSLLDGTGETTLASTTSAMSPPYTTCPELVFDAPEAGIYAVHVDMRAGTYAGDFYLRAESH